MISIVIIAMVALIISLQSCKKDDPFYAGVGVSSNGNGGVAVNANLGFKVAGVWVNVSFGTGGANYYPYNAYGSYLYPNNAIGNPITICYITSAASPTNIVAYDATMNMNASMGVVDCVSNMSPKMQDKVWKDLMNYIAINKYAIVAVEWDNHWTTGSWSGHIRL